MENKKLLIKDLCARLPYGIKISVNDKIETLEGINVLDSVVEYGSYLSSDIEDIKPYLFPLSSMTPEQKETFCFLAEYERREEDCGRHTETYYYDMVGHEDNLYPNYTAIDWLNENHFDYKGLIEKGLAIDATRLNIY